MQARLRVQQICIDMPKASNEPWVNLTVQRVEMNEQGQDVNVIDRWGQVNTRLSDIYGMIVRRHDPLCSSLDEMSGAGVAQGITAIAISLVIAKFGGTLNEKGYIMVTS